ncbi:MAG: universal stress protein [Deltaproteobacteria bacterium]|nr:universal stress protein [Deltaproteobacteria bacterium]
MKKILLGLDGSEGSFKALSEAIVLSKQLDSELHTISVHEVPQYPGTMGEVMEEKEAANGVFGAAIEKAKTTAKNAGVPLRCHVMVGHEVKGIVEFIKAHKVDLLVIGFMGHSAIYNRIMGGTCQNLVRLAPCSVLVVK